MTNPGAAEAADLVSRYIDGVLTSAQEKRLDELIEQDPALVDIYTAMMQLHGQLTWCGSSVPSTDRETEDVLATTSEALPFPQHTDHLSGRDRSGRRRYRTVSRLAWLLVPGLIAAACVPVIFRSPPMNTGNTTMTASGDVQASASPNSPEFNPPGRLELELAPLQFEGLRRKDEERRGESMAAVNDSNPPNGVFRSNFTDAEVIAAINEQITVSLSENAVRPSPQASDAEWLRRAWLTLAGRIPTLEEAQAFYEQSETDRRARLIDTLLNSSERQHHLAEAWTALLIGRADRQQVNREALLGYLKDAFAENRSWIDIVGDLVSAEGRNDENGAANFLLAHLDNQATPATAVTARLFLGEQLQCVQCHDHPFVPEIDQREYWELNAFFQNTERQFPVIGDEQPALMKSGMIPVSLVEHSRGGMTFFETPQGRQVAVVPEYDANRIPAESTRRRRAALTEFLASDSRSRVARAMVNRVWSQCFGYGFTNPVDDMGSHVPVSHPKVLDLLTKAFVKSGCDLRRLQLWLTLSDPWQCTSQVIDANRDDDPESGTVPLFSRVYCQRMPPEVMYDSIRIAIRTVSGQPVPAASDDDHRRNWVTQFVRPYNTDENDEANGFDGSMAQAMVMMNGPDVNEAVHLASRAAVGIDCSTPSATEILSRIAQAVLTREPTVDEVSIFRRHLKQRSRSSSFDQALPQVAEDMMWAYLNSSEFSLIH